MYGMKLSFPYFGGEVGGGCVRNFRKAGTVHLFYAEVLPVFLTRQKGSRINLRFCFHSILGNQTRLDLTGFFTHCIRRVTNPKFVDVLALK